MRRPACGRCPASPRPAALPPPLPLPSPPPSAAAACGRLVGPHAPMKPAGRAGLAVVPCRARPRPMPAEAPAGSCWRIPRPRGSGCHLPMPAEAPAGSRWEGGGREGERESRRSTALAGSARRRRRRSMAGLLLALAAAAGRAEAPMKRPVGGRRSVQPREAAAWPVPAAGGRAIAYIMTALLTALRRRSSGCQVREMRPQRPPSPQPGACFLFPTGWVDEAADVLSLSPSPNAGAASFPPLPAIL